MLGPAFILRPGPSLFPGPCHRLPTQAQMPGPLQNPASHRPLPTDSILFMPNPLPESRLLRLKFPNAATILQVCPPEASNMVGCFTPWHSCDLCWSPWCCQLHTTTAAAAAERPWSQVASVPRFHPQQLIGLPLPPWTLPPGPVLSLGHPRSFPPSTTHRAERIVSELPQDAGVRSPHATESPSWGQKEDFIPCTQRMRTTGLIRASGFLTASSAPGPSGPSQPCRDSPILESCSPVPPSF